LKLPKLFLGYSKVINLNNVQLRDLQCVGINVAKFLVSLEDFFIYVEPEILGASLLLRKYLILVLTHVS